MSVSFMDVDGLQMRQNFREDAEGEGISEESHKSQKGRRRERRPIRSRNMPARSMEFLPELEALSPMSSIAGTERDTTALSSGKRDSRIPSDSRKSNRRLPASSVGTNGSEATTNQDCVQKLYPFVHLHSPTN